AAVQGRRHRRRGMSASPEEPSQAQPRLSRRAMLAASGAGAAGPAPGVAAGTAVATERDEADVRREAGPVPFWGPHQAGIATAAQDRPDPAMFDVTSGRAADLRER